MPRFDPPGRLLRGPRQKAVADLDRARPRLAGDFAVSTDFDQNRWIDDAMSDGDQIACTPARYLAAARPATTAAQARQCQRQAECADGEQSKVCTPINAAVIIAVPDTAADGDAFIVWSGVWRAVTSFGRVGRSGARR